MASDLVSDALGGVSNAMRSGRGFTRNPRNTQNRAGLYSFISVTILSTRTWFACQLKNCSE